jgi:hypothetical protein
MFHISQGLFQKSIKEGLECIIMTQNIVMRLKKGPEVTRRNETHRGEKVGPAGPTLGPVGALFRLMAAAFWSLLPTPPWKPSKVSLHRF